jgi:hypothetical protein
MAALLSHFEEERVVRDDVPVMQVLYIRKISLQEEDVLPVQTNRLHRQDLPSVPVRALLDDPVRALADLLPDDILFQKKRKALLRRGRFLGIGLGLLRGFIIVGRFQGGLLDAPLELECRLFENGHLSQGVPDVRHFGPALVRPTAALHAAAK